MKTIEITKKQLYDLVWSTPISKLAEKYALSGEGIRALCNKHEIPIPKNGYWSKIKFNKPVIRIKLTTANNDNKIVLTLREEGSPVNLDQSPLTILTKQIQCDKKAPLTVPAKLSKPDILIQNTIAFFNKRKKERYYRNDKLDTISIDVEDANFNRALRIMDTFIKLLKHRGHSFRRDRNNYGPHIVIEDVEFYFYIREAQKRIPPKEGEWGCTFIPTGILVIKIGKSIHSSEWRDSSVKLEFQLARIVAKMEIEAQEELIWREECRIHAIQRAEEERIKKELKKRREIELTKTKQFFYEALRHQKATYFRNFIEKKEQNAANLNTLTAELKDWINWAKEKADWYDPLINKVDELLNEKDKENLDKQVEQKSENYYYNY